jgi:hypothetical protein
MTVGNVFARPTSVVLYAAIIVTGPYAQDGQLVLAALGGLGKLGMSWSVQWVPRGIRPGCVEPQM